MAEHERERRKDPYPCDIHASHISDLRKTVFGKDGLETRVTKIEVGNKFLKGFLIVTVPPILIGVLSMAAKMFLFAGGK